jgi:serine/threonine protein kinase
MHSWQKSIYLLKGGDFRSPEEYGKGSYVDESVDIWPVGNLIFTLLTGLWPYYHIPRKQRPALQQLQLKGIAPYISPKFQHHSYIERQMVSIMNSTFIRQPHLRPTIFDIVKRLKDVKLVHENNNSDG